MSAPLVDENLDDLRQVPAGGDCVDRSVRSGRARRLNVAMASGAALAITATMLTTATPAAGAITPAAGVYLRSVLSGKCMTVTGVGTADDASVVQFTCSASTNDTWRAVGMGDGTFQIVVVRTGKCLSVKGASTSNNAGVVQHTCNPATATAKNDRWRPRPVPGTSSYQLVAEHSGKCIFVANGSTSNNALMLQFSCTAAAQASEQWYFPPATANPSVVPIIQNTSISALQPSPAPGITWGAINYAYVDNAGRLLHGYQPNPTSFDTLQWSVVSGGEAFSGQPSLAEQSDGRLHLVGHNNQSDIWTRTQASRSTPGWSDWQDVAGSLPNHPALGRLPDGKLVIFALDSAGGLWHLPQDGVNTPFMGWRFVGGSGLVGTPVVITMRDGLQVFAHDTAGTLQTATYRAGVLSDWASLGGAGLTGTPAVVLHPGYSIRVFARTAQGYIVTKRQNSTGDFESAWTQLGSLVTAGSPSALLSPAEGRMEVVVRTADGDVYNTGETAVGSGVWREWQNTLGENDVPAATDPVAFSYNDGNPQWGYVSKTVEGSLLVHVARASAGLTRADSPKPGPAFTGHRLPAPPR